jgi:threonine/homoserine/homoserine lactone efflux protein
MGRWWITTIPQVRERNFMTKMLASCQGHDPVDGSIAQKEHLMSLQHWLAFVVASQILLIIPGPTVLMVVSYALGHGRKPATAIVAGVALGDLTAMTASMLGLGAVLAASATIFAALRWIGAAYLIYLGVKLWRAPIKTEAMTDTQTADPRRLFLHAYLVAALNPKAIFFFVAFVPQFMDATHSFLSQVILLETTFVILATLNASAFAMLAASARRTLRDPRVQRAVNRTGGSLLIGAGLAAVEWRKAGP